MGFFTRGQARWGYRRLRDEKVGSIWKESEDEGEKPTLYKATGPEHLILRPILRCNTSAVITMIVTALALIIVSSICTYMYVLRGVPGCRPESFTPIHSLVNIQYEIATIRTGSLANSSTPDHIYRMPQSQEVHEAWQNLTEASIFPISRADVIRLGKDPNVAVRAPDNWDWPKDSYLASMEFPHQLHCLDVLRRNLVHNYHTYWGSLFGFTPNLVWEWHITHCLDILRQHLSCNADTTVYVYEFHHLQEQPVPDFSVRKECVNFEHLSQWNAEMRQKNLDQGHIPPWRQIVDHITEAPDDPSIPNVTKEIRYVSIDDDTQVPIGPIRGLEEQDYCLGSKNDFIV